jgi:hypothetical protein
MVDAVATAFFCRVCRVEVRSDRVPTGWLSLRRYRGGLPTHIGLYCSAGCVAAWVGGEDDPPGPTA